jgi:hypothetical protein
LFIVRDAIDQPRKQPIDRSRKNAAARATSQAQRPIVRVRASEPDESPRRQTKKRMTGRVANLIASFCRQELYRQGLQLPQTSTASQSDRDPDRRWIEWFSKLL